MNETHLARLEELPQPPLWALPLVLLGAAVPFVSVLPVGLDPVPDVALEGLYLGLAVLVVVPIRRLGSTTLEVAWGIFVVGRFVDFLDELFVEPEPLVEPYVSGFLMVLSLSVFVVGAFAITRQRDRRIDDLRAKTEALSLKNRVIDEAPIGVTVADMTRDGEPLVEVNRQFTRTTGYEAAETVGRNCRFLQGEDTDPEKVARMRRAIDAGESVQVTLRNYRKDGELFWNEITLAPLTDDDGEVVHYAGFQQDATERKELERALKSQRDDLDVLNQMLQHDVRNKLQFVGAAAPALREHVSEAGRDHLDTIEESAAEAVAITETAQELSQAMLDPEPTSQPIRLSETLRTEVEDVRSAFAHASIEFEDDPPDVDVAADGMLGSVFRNLLRNAVQHNDGPDPRVTVTTARSDGTVTVRIADDGPGVPDDLDVFARGAKGLDSDGTGMGTYLVETLVSRYGGEVWVEDNDPTGAIFAVELPVYAHDEASTATPA